MPKRLVYLDAQIDCVRREIERRKTVYPKLVAAGKLSQLRTDAEIAMMRAVLMTLLWAENRSDSWYVDDKVEEDAKADFPPETIELPE